jgi:ribosome-associated protein
MSTFSSKIISVGPGLELAIDDIQFDAVRASGPGGQNVNKVSSAVHLRFDIVAARLPEAVRQRLLNSADKRISSSGVLVIKAQRHRTQVKNREDAIERLVLLLKEASRAEKRRIATKPSRSAREKRLKRKDINSKNKRLRKVPQMDS